MRVIARGKNRVVGVISSENNRVTQPEVTNVQDFEAIMLSFLEIKSRFILSVETPWFADAIEYRITYVFSRRARLIEHSRIH